MLWVLSLPVSAGSVKSRSTSFVVLILVAMLSTSSLVAGRGEKESVRLPTLTSCLADDAAARTRIDDAVWGVKSVREAAVMLLMR